jgi:hypothetical protein
MHTKLLVASCFCIILLLCGVWLHANKTYKTFCEKNIYKIESDLVQVKPVLEQSRFVPSLFLF